MKNIALNIALNVIAHNTLENKHFKFKVGYLLANVR